MKLQQTIYVIMNTHEELFFVAEGKATMDSNEIGDLNRTLINDHPSTIVWDEDKNIAFPFMSKSMAEHVIETEGLRGCSSIEYHRVLIMNDDE